jgi:hypothetical protein
LDRQGAQQADATQPKHEANLLMGSHIAVISVHPRRAEIETDIAKGLSGAAIARKYSTEAHPISIWSAIRFIKNMKRKRPTALAALKAEVWQCTPEQLEQLRLETSQGWLSQMRNQFSRMLQLQEACLESGNVKGATQAAAQIAKLLELIGKAVDELSSVGSLNVSMTTNNLVLSPAYHSLRTALLDALRKHPDARADVLSALASIETAPEAPPALKLVSGGNHE